MIKFSGLRFLGACMLLLVFSFNSFVLSAASRLNVLVAPGTVSASSAAVLWDKQYASKPVEYTLLLNGKVYETTKKTNFVFSNLQPNTTYTVTVQIAGQVNQKNELSIAKFKTSPKGKIFNIIAYGAKADTTVNTKAIQAAINACTAGGTVYIPKGTFLSGALYLKSNMTLHIEEGGTLKGTTQIADYLPMLLNRFEGWEMKTYASLINAGTLNRNGVYNVKNLTITGKGSIVGGGRKLGEAMTKASGIRSRGRLICLMNAQNVSLSYLTITEPPCWTIHYIYSDNVTCHDLKIITKNIRNGDGIDPDSSTDSYIFNCTFDTGDDCIAIKSGKNPEGFFVAKPTTNVRITNCDFIRGHGISIGSEMSGGVNNVLVQDCTAGNLLHGLQIKGTKDRGGYVKNVTVTDCQLLKITIFSAVNYNNDGEAAPEIPTFENFVFKNIDLSKADVASAVIDINGFKDPQHKLRNVTFDHIELPNGAKVVVKDAQKITFTKVQSATGAKPNYVVENSVEVTY